MSSLCHVLEPLCSHRSNVFYQSQQVRVWVTQQLVWLSILTHLSCLQYLVRKKVKSLTKVWLLFNHHYLVRVHDSIKTMSNGQHCLILELFSYDILNDCISPDT